MYDLSSIAGRDATRERSSFPIAGVWRGKKYLWGAHFDRRGIDPEGAARAGATNIGAPASPNREGHFVMSAPVRPALIAGSSRFSTRLARTRPVLST